jgi:RNA polymerase sigma-70 factor (ECF subfamily)
LSVPVLPSTPDALDHLEERDLVERAKRDSEAFAELYRRHHRSVHRYAVSRLRNQADAEDATSDVFVKALLAIGRYEERGIPFRMWLFQIAVHRVADHWRARRPTEDLGECEGLAAAGSLEDLVAERDQVRRVVQAAQQLPARQREVLSLRFGGDLKVNDVARRMHKTPGAVKLLQNRAVTGVRRALLYQNLVGEQAPEVLTEQPRHQPGEAAHAGVHVPAAPTSPQPIPTAARPDPLAAASAATPRRRAVPGSRAGSPPAGPAPAVATSRPPSASGGCGLGQGANEFRGNDDVSLSVSRNRTRTLPLEPGSRRPWAGTAKYTEPAVEAAGSTGVVASGSRLPLLPLIENRPPDVPRLELGVARRQSAGCAPVPGSEAAVLGLAS